MRLTQQKCAVGFRPSFSMDVLTTLLIILLFTPALHTTSEPRPCSPELSVEIIGGHLYPNESLLAPNGILYPKEQYWEELSSDNASMVTRGCVCHFKNCIRKCCPEHHIYATSFDGTCVRKDHALLEPFRPNITDVTTAEYYADFHVLYGDPCKHGKYALSDDTETYFISKNGTLHVYPTDMGDGNTSSTAEWYCLEVYLQFNDSNPADEHVATIIPFHCFPPEEEMPVQSAVFLIYPIGMLISEPFLLATFLVYAIIPELRNIHGKSLMSHVTSLFVAYLCLAIVQLGKDDISTSFCTVLAFIILFSFLASFFWLNVMCFDLWWTFSGFRPFRGSVRERDHKKFIIYSLYCWGSPLIMLIIAMIMDLSPNISDTFIKPGFGHDSCWFRTEAAKWAYFYGIVAVIIVANMIMFITTALKILQLKKETAMLKGSESKRHDDDENKQRFSLYLKLFIVMGVNWAMEVLSAVAGGPEMLWYITDIGNTLQGVLIFIIFVWKDKIRKLIVKRFNPESKSQTNSNYSRSTRVFSSTRTSSTRNTSRIKNNACQGVQEATTSLIEPPR